MPDLRLEPPVSVEECREAGITFGKHNGKLSRLAFEEKLVKRPLALEHLLSRSGPLAEDTLAAFDQAAWQTWEGLQRSPVPRD
jgi:hypothetical protein